MEFDGSATGLLERAYTGLKLDEGRLLKPLPQPSDNVSDWQSVGDWLSLASRMNVDRLFFVGDDPILVFSVMPDDATEYDIVQLYKQAWSLSRPRCLFLATSQEIRVYSLSEPPPSVRRQEEGLSPLRVIERTADVAEALHAFRRDSVESGRTFQIEEAFNRPNPRADQQLIVDIVRVARALTRRGLPLAIAQSLIERVILVRYLEDRGVITEGRIEEIARSRKKWANLIQSSPTRNVGRASHFISCLSDARLTNAVFAALEREFNGDLFVVSGAERSVVNQEHYTLLQRMLTGATDDQGLLFLWAYDFSVVPISVISSMYEHFYHLGERDDESSTHYTPSELVEFVVSRVLTSDELDRDPKICDPACGSGVFLVEAYRAIVRHEMARRGRSLSTNELRQLLVTRIHGIDINGEAIRLAAFSLYLSFLNYQSPQDIRRAGPLPRLLYTGTGDPTAAVLAVSDAFSSSTELSQELFDAPTKGRPSLPWSDGYFDVVIGNPPWDEPSGKASKTFAEIWASSKGLPIGDRSPSQLFLWRTLSLLRPGGLCGLLVAGSVVYNSRSTSQEFRRAWLSQVSLGLIANFVQARRLFFRSAIAPFFLLVYRNSPSDLISRVSYVTVKPSSALDVTGFLTYAHLERRVTDQESLRSREYLWKVFAWGGHRDEAFMRRLDLERTIDDIVPASAARGYGYQRGSKEPSAALKELPSLKNFEPWGAVRPEWIEPAPVGVKRQPTESLYVGRRLLIRRGVTVGFGPRVRLEEDAYSFRHTTYCISLTSVATWMAELIFAVALSSVGRYRMFMTSGSWGIWHDSALATDILRIPIPECQENDPNVVEARGVVRELREWSPDRPSGEWPMARAVPPNDYPEELIDRLDVAVGDLFGLTDSERDLVKDWSKYQLPEASGQLRPSRASDEPIDTYIRTFVNAWDAELAPAARLGWQVVRARGDAAVGVVFEFRDTDDTRHPNIALDNQSESSRWQVALNRLGSVLRRQVSRRLATDGVIRSVSDSHIMIVKRNEDRLWSASSAREDFDATLVQAINLQSL
jgi:N-6 DNA Methylase